MRIQSIPREWPRQINDILDKLSGRTSEAVSLGSLLKDSSKNLDEIYSECVEIGNPNTAISEAHGHLRIALRNLVSLTHDIEIVKKVDRVLRDANIDLSDLVPTRQIDYGFGNRIKIEQNSAAEIHNSHVDKCLTVERGHMGITVPLSVEELGLEYDISIGLTIALQQLPGPTESMTRFVVDLPSICEAGRLNRVMQGLLLEEVRSETLKYEGILHLPRIPDLNIGFIDYCAGELDGLARIHGLIRKRSRKKIGKITKLPEWADSAVKFTNEILEDETVKLIRQAGLRPTSRLRYVGNNEFQIGCSLTKNYTKRVGCTDFGIVVTIRLVLRIKLSIGFSNYLVIETRVHDKNVKVKMKPRVIGWVLDKYLNLGANILKDKLPHFQQKQYASLPSAKRAAVSSNKNSVTIFMSTRNTFGQ